MGKELQSLECPECGAPVAADATQCEYCNSFLGRSKASPAERGATRDPSPPTKPTWNWPRLAPGEGEFGFWGWWPATVAAGGAAVLYGAGWFLEDTTYWLDDRAITVWAVLLPLWLCAWAAAWRAPRRGWLPGFLIAATMFAFHMAIPWLLRNRLNDDLVGIGAAFAAGALAGWLVGRIIHFCLRWGRARRHRSE